MRKITIFFTFFIFFSVTAISVAQSSRPMVLDIDVVISADNDHSILTWSITPSLSEQIQELLVYRNEDSIINSDTIASKTPLAVLLASEMEYKDILTDSKRYYYAVIARQKDGTLYDVIIPSVNATTSPATLASPKTQDTVFVASQIKEIIIPDTSPPSGIQELPLRQKPLPYLHILPEQQTEKGESLHTETLKSTDNFTLDASPIILFKPDIFPEDAIDSDATGDTYILYSIVASFIVPGNWLAAQTELEQFLQINRSEEITARATFYLGQAYYFNKNYRASLSSFQKSEKLQPILSRKWITEVLTHYSID